MENASKALIIAGAILISILIISLGIIIYRQAAGIVNDNSMDEFETTTFNTKFSQFAGDNVRATVVRSLFDQVQASNASSDNKVKIYNTASPTENTEEMNTNQIESSATYNISVNYNTSTGLIDKIYVVKVSKQTD